MNLLNASTRDQSLDPKFFPNGQDGRFQYKIDLQGRSSNPVTAALPPYWEFKNTANEIGNTVLTTPGGGYTTGTFSTTVSPAGGTNATVNVTSVDDDSTYATSITTPGTGYTTGIKS